MSVIELMPPDPHLKDTLESDMFPYGQYERQERNNGRTNNRNYNHRSGRHFRSFGEI